MDIILPYGNDVFAIWAIRSPGDVDVWLQITEHEWLTGGNVPDTYSLIPTCGDNVSTIRTERRIRDPLAVSVQHAERCQRPSIPEPHGKIAARRDDPPPIRAETCA